MEPAPTLAEPYNASHLRHKTLEREAPATSALLTNRAPYHAVDGSFIPGPNVGGPSVGVMPAECLTNHRAL